MGTNEYAYVYDPIGNRLQSAVAVGGGQSDQMAYVANSLNQYAAVTNHVNPVGILPSYDLDGNMLTNGSWAYTWDGENRLAAAYSNEVLVVTNVYDHLWRRIAKIAAAGTSVFLYDGWNMVGESVGTVTNCYVWGLDLSGTIQGAGGVGGLLAAETFDGGAFGVRYPCYDANGNVVQFLGGNGASVAVFKYDAFGCIFSETAAPDLCLPFRFSTKEIDEETGLYYYGYRYYCPALGRWVNRDPIGERGGANTRVLLDNNAINYIDTLGLKGMKFKVEKCQAVLIIGHGSDSNPHEWEFPAPKDDPKNCAVGGALVCWPESNNPDWERRWPRVPRHNQTIGDGTYDPGSVAPADSPDAGDHNDPAIFERNLQNAIRNALSKEAIEHIMDQLCEDCDEVSFVFRTTDKNFGSDGYMRTVKAETGMGPLEEKTKTQPCCINGEPVEAEAIDLKKIDK